MGTFSASNITLYCRSCGQVLQVINSLCTKPHTDGSSWRSERAHHIVLPFPETGKLHRTYGVRERRRTVSVEITHSSSPFGAPTYYVHPECEWGCPKCQGSGYLLQSTNNRTRGRTESVADIKHTCPQRTSKECTPPVAADKREGVW